MKTKGNEYFYSISGLTVPKYSISMSFTENLEFFMNIVKTKCESLEADLENGNIVRFVFEMEELDKLLCSIHAYGLESEAARLLRMADIGNGILCKSLLPQFTKNMSLLAAEVQIAQNKSFTEQRAKTSPIERYGYIITTLKSFQILADSGQFDEIFDIAITIDELHKGDDGTQFIACLSSKDSAMLRQTINYLIDSYTEKIAKHTDEEVVVLKQVMIVDDQPEVLMVLGKLLSGHYQVFSMPDGHQALRFLSKHEVDAYILDIDMPGMDGFELAKRIKQIDAKNKPIIFLTSNNSKESVLKSVFYGAKEFIVKPINKDVVLEKLKNILS